MNWLTVAWSMCASACAFLALMHGIMWLQNPRSKVYLLSAAMALSASGVAFGELLLLQTSDIEVYRRLLVWQNLWIFGLLAALVWVVYVHLGTARRWLAIVITTAWSVALIVNFLSPSSLVFADITALEESRTWWGEPFVLPRGTTNPWKYLADLTSVLIVVYVVDAAVAAYRMGKRRRALLTGGSIVFFMITAGIHTPLVDAGLIATPYMIGFAFLAIVLAMTYDIVTDAVRASRYEKLAAAEQMRWNMVIDGVQLAVLSVDAGGRIVYTNPFFQRLSGFPESELKGRPLGRFLQEVEDGLISPSASSTPFAHWELMSASGKTRWLALSSVPIPSGEGEPSDLLYIGADITTQLEVQKDLAAARREMERLGRANALGELATSLAHELNQPLAAILANSQAAQRMLDGTHPDMQEIRDILDDIVRDDKRAGAVIQHLRAMLAHEEIPREPFSIVDAVREVVTLLRGELTANRVKLDLRCLAQPIPATYGGRIEIQQVMVNLILNAVHAMSETERREITIDLGYDGNAATVTVGDTGPGIPDEKARAMFDPFFTTRSGGLGMGLTICRRIVEAHGGRIRAGTLPDGGACVQFTLPSSGSEDA